MPLASFLRHFLFLVLLALFLQACAAQKQVPAAGDKHYTIKTIAVLPSDTISLDEEQSKGTVESLEKGAFVLNDIINEYLGSKEGVQFVSPERQDSLLTEYNQSKTARAISIGKKLHVDAVLTSTVNRYKERAGQEYSIDHPASVSFEYRLLLVTSGQSLCAGVFDETQQSISENLLSFRKAFARRGKWVTTNALAQEGIEEKFGACRFLKK